MQLVSLRALCNGLHSKGVILISVIVGSNWVRFNGEVVFSGLVLLSV